MDLLSFKKVFETLQFYSFVCWTRSVNPSRGHALKSKNQFIVVIFHYHFSSLEFLLFQEPWVVY